jgi:hypothetical protein
VYALETLGFKANPRTGGLEEISPEGGYLPQTTNPARPINRTINAASQPLGRQNLWDIINELSIGIALTPCSTPQSAYK